MERKIRSPASNDINDMLLQLWESGFFKDIYKPDEIALEFYPYTTLKNTIKKRDSAIIIRISDMLSDAPMDVIWSLVILLFCKLERRKPSEEHVLCYRDYVNSKSMRIRIARKRRERVKKDLLGPRGKTYDLRLSFNRVNRKYFQKRLRMPILSWSRNRTKTRFGHHDEALNTIVISRTLDDEAIPKFVLDYVMFHEALHIKHKSSFENGKRRMHTRVFLEDERRFSQREQAEAMLKRISSGLKLDS